MLLLGIDIGTSSIKVSVVNAATRQCLGSAQFPDTESDIISIQTGWAEQSPELWWQHLQYAVLKLHAEKLYDPRDIVAVGLAYQMHGLVMIDKHHQPVRNSIIWCDSRAVELGEDAFKNIGTEICMEHLLNSPANFTASKLAWVRLNEPGLYEKTFKIMLPGDFIGLKLTGDITTTIPALSEGIFWDFKENRLSGDIIEYFGLDSSLFPEIRPVFAEHGKITDSAAKILRLRSGIPLSYKAGDQLNNAWALNVLKPGEVAATAGTSGVIYAVTDKFISDKDSRVNTFAHVNHSKEKVRLGVLLCINAAGIFNRWIKNTCANGQEYAQMNTAARNIHPGSEGVLMLPFGNGAERVLGNKTPGAQIIGLDLNKHTRAHLYRAAQEAVVFAFRYGLEILKENAMNTEIVRAGKSSMFLSDVFTGEFANCLNLSVELYDADGSIGAAMGAGYGAGIYKSSDEAVGNRSPIETVEPSGTEVYEQYYQGWLAALNRQLD